jgi:hypothetical protein
VIGCRSRRDLEPREAIDENVVAAQAVENVTTAAPPNCQGWRTLIAVLEESELLGGLLRKKLLQLRLDDRSEAVG